jgi:hypothetical protein
MNEVAGGGDHFGFLKDIDPKYDPHAIRRLELRKRFIIDLNRSQIEGGTVLDLASHDGRWVYAFAMAGAARVVGVEARSNLVGNFRQFPASIDRGRVELQHRDLFAALEQFAAEGRTFDVVAVLGIFYHIMDHYRLLRLVGRLKPGLVIIDSEFMTADQPVIQLVLENPEKDVCSVATEGEKRIPIGIPSSKALEMMAASLEFDVQWQGWESVPSEERGPVSDYFSTGPKLRRTCFLRKKPGA